LFGTSALDGFLNTQKEEITLLLNTPIIKFALDTEGIYGNNDEAAMKVSQG